MKNSLLAVAILVLAIGARAATPAQADITRISRDQETITIAAPIEIAIMNAPSTSIAADMLEIADQAITKSEITLAAAM